MSTRRTRRAAAAAEVTEEVITIETRSKRTRAGPRKAASTIKASSTKAKRASTPTDSAPHTQPATRSDAQPATRPDAVASTPAPSTNNKRRLRSTATEAASPLRALDEQPAKRQRTTSRKVPARTHTPTPSKPTSEDDDEEETPIFFTKSFETIASELREASLRERNASLEAKYNALVIELANARAELAQVRAREAEALRKLSLRDDALKTSPVTANTPTAEFDSFDVEESEPAEPPKSAFMTGDESAMALLRHVQEAARSPKPTTPSAEIETSPAPKSPSPVASEKLSTPSRSIFSSFTSPFTALKSLFGTSTRAPSSPTPSRLPPADTLTEVLSMPPTPVGERTKRASKKTRRPNRIVKALLQGIDQQDVDKASAWAEQIAIELQKDSTAGEKRKRLETPVVFRDLKHLPSSKPWQSGFSLPEDVLDLEDDDVVPAWAVYTSMIEEQQRETKKTKTTNTTPVDNDMPASLNEAFGASTTTELDFEPRRSIDPSPMFETPLRHQEGGNIFTELHGHDVVASDRENLQRELKAGSSQLQNEIETFKFKPTESLQRVHDPDHGSFSVPDSDSEDEEEVSASPVWTQAPPPAPTPAHVSLPNTTHQEEVERQRQRLMKHTPHKPSRLQQVSYPSPSLMSDAGDSPLKFSDLGEIPGIEPLVFGEPDLDAALAAISTSESLQAQLSAMHWSMPVVTYDSEEEEISPV